FFIELVNFLIPHKGYIYECIFTHIGFFRGDTPKPSLAFRGVSPKDSSRSSSNASFPSLINLA
ncbi:MAG: hypothetical protein ABIG86_02575, partial [Patescibacteria group bacterium]